MVAFPYLLWPYVFKTCARVWVCLCVSICECVVWVCMCVAVELRIVWSLLMIRSRLSNFSCQLYQTLLANTLPNLAHLWSSCLVSPVWGMTVLYLDYRPNYPLIFIIFDCFSQRKVLPLLTLCLVVISVSKPCQSLWPVCVATHSFLRVTELCSSCGCT